MIFLKIFLWMFTSLVWGVTQSFIFLRENNKYNFVMRSEKPCTTSKNVILSFSWHHIEERTKSILKKNCLKSSILRRGMTFQRSKLQKASFEKQAFNVFLSWCVENNSNRFLHWVRKVVTMTHDHDDTPHAILTLLVVESE